MSLWMWMCVNPLQSLVLICSLAPKLVAETFQNRQARVAITESRADYDACAHGTRARPWLILRCARERLVRVRVLGRDQLFGFLCFSPLACFLPCFLWSMPSLFQPEITSKHIKASYGIKEKLEFIKIRLKKHVFTLKHKYGRDNKTMLIHRLNVTKGYQNTLNSVHNKPSNWGLSTSFKLAIVGH